MLVPATAHAQPADPAPTPTAPSATPGAPAPAPAPAKPAPNPNDNAARQEYLDGDRRYAEGRYEEAVRHFNRAYQLSKRPALLYNLTNAYERMGNYAKAHDSLKQYLADAAPTKGAAALRQRVRQLALRAAKKKQLNDELDRLRNRPPCPTCAVPPPPKPTPRLAYGLLGTGAVAFATATVFGFVARGAHNDAADNCVDSGGLYCSSGADSALDREKRFALLTDVSLFVGVAAVTTGAYLLWRHRRSERKAPKTVAAPVPLRKGLAIGVATRF